MLAYLFFEFVWVSNFTRLPGVQLAEIHLESVLCVDFSMKIRDFATLLNDHTMIPWQEMNSIPAAEAIQPLAHAVNAHTSSQLISVRILS